MDDAFYKRLLDNISDGVYFVDRDRRITYWNKGAERISGYSPHEVTGRSCADNLLVHVDATGKCLCLNGCPVSACLKDGQSREAEVFLHHRNGHRVPVVVRINPLHGDQGEVIGVVELFSDNYPALSARQRIHELESQALVDPLTMIGNRRFVEAALVARLGELRRYDWPMGVLFLDIDHFKQINDRFGHDIGDAVIKMVAQTLSGTMRPFDAVGRWGGEEFVAVAPSVKSEGLQHLAERCRAMIERSRMIVNGVDLSVTVSIGGALGRAEDTPETLIKRADAMMYESKRAGRNRVSVLA